MAQTSVSKLEDVKAGVPKPVQAGDQYIVLIKTGEEVSALEDTCSHAYCSLSDGEIEGNAIVCPCHGASFDIRTGNVLTGPATVPVKRFEVAIQNGEVLVTTD